MIELPSDALGKAACGRSGLPLLAVCPCGARRTVPFLRLKTHDDDATPLYGRPFKCRLCGRSAVTLFAFETLAELAAIQAERARSDAPPHARLGWHSTPSRSTQDDPNAGYL